VNFANGQTDKTLVPYSAEPAEALPDFCLLLLFSPKSDERKNEKWLTGRQGRPRRPF
jgi:hypothetical protein